MDPLFKFTVIMMFLIIAAAAFNQNKCACKEEK